MLSHRRRSMTHTVASSHGRTYGSSAPDESMSTTGVSIATVRCTAVIFLGIVASSRSTGNEWVSRLASYYTKVPRSSPARTGWSVGDGIRDAWRAGRHCLMPHSSGRLAEREPCATGTEPAELPKSAGESHVLGDGRCHSPTLFVDSDAAGDYRMAPGLRMPSGSSAFLILWERAITSGPSCAGRAAFLARPTPCSPVIVPPSSIASCMISLKAR
jgi:hypothetical protein